MLSTAGRDWHGLSLGSDGAGASCPTEADPLLRLPLSEVAAASLAPSEAASDDTDAPSEGGSFWAFLCTNRNFQLYALSGLISHAGEWFGYIACVRVVQDNSGDNGDDDDASSSALAISMLVVLRLLPTVFFSALGGVLSDSADRKRLMIRLDVLSAALSLLYLPAVRLGSLKLVYALVFSQEAIGAFYSPADDALYPQLMPTRRLLEQGAVWSETAYAVVASFGASLGGFFVVWFGMDTCFVIDSLMGFSCAALLYMIPGEWTAEKEDGSEEESGDGEQSSCSSESEEPPHSFEYYYSMASDGLDYVWGSSLASYVLIKATGMLLYGAVEVIAVAFSEQGSAPDDASRKLGIIYTFYGLGCVFGPFASNAFTDIEHPRTLVVASVASFGLISFSWGGLALVQSFGGMCILMALASLGAEVLWLDSDLLLLSHSKNEFLGRVTAVDGALSVSLEALSSLLAGILQDKADLSPESVCLVFAVLGLACVVIWMLFLARRKTAGGLLLTTAVSHSS